MKNNKQSHVITRLTETSNHNSESTTESLKDVVNKPKRKCGC